MLSDCYLPRLGGIEVQVHDLAGRLRARGHEVAVFTATPGPHGGTGRFADDVDGVPVHRLTIRLPFELPVNPFAPPELRRRLAAGGYDVAHVHTGVVSPFAVDSTRVALGLGLPTTMTWHCMLDRLAPAFAAAGYVRRWAERGIAMNAVSAVAAAPLQRIVGDADTVTVLPNGIDVAQWAPAPDPGAEAARAAAAGPAAAPVQVVSAMRLAARKRPLALLRTMRRVREALPEGVGLRLLVLGDGPSRRGMERYVAAHEMAGWVSMPGRVSRAELRSAYLVSHVYVAPARLESFGIAALEARTVGVPVVGRVGSGVGEFITDGVNGLLAADDDEMARDIGRLVSDAGLRETMARLNRSRPPAQTWDRVVEQAEAEYARAVAGARAAVG
jgi:glycosyltransferase involved in cell wall biosynthesis